MVASGAGSERSGPVGGIWAGLGRSGPVWGSLGRSGAPWAGLDRFGPVQTVRIGSGWGGAVQAVWIGRVGPAWAGLDRTRSGGPAGPA